jgi:hypothetical protein
MDRGTIYDRPDVSSLGPFMNAKIILKHEEKEYLLQRTAEDSLARSVLAAALPYENQPALVVFSCDERAAYALLQLAERHCGCAWRVMHYQMVRLGLLSGDPFYQIAPYQDNLRHPECHLQLFDDPAATRSNEMPRPLSPTGLYDHPSENSSYLNG